MYLGHFSAVPTPLGPSRVVARVLSFCTPSYLAAGQSRAAARARRQTSRATLPSTDTSHDSGKNQPAMDGARGARLPLAKGVRLRGTEARCGWRGLSRRSQGRRQRKHSEGASPREEVASLGSSKTKSSPK